MDIDLHFSACLWIWHSEKGGTAWHFITLPLEQAETVRMFRQQRTRGFGAVKVKATIGQTSWKTSIFPSKAHNSYLLPVKACVRKSEKLTAGDEAQISLSFDMEEG